MKKLIIIPTQMELNSFKKSLIDYSLRPIEGQIGRLPVSRFPGLDITLARGGLGKVQFAVQMQHLLDSGLGWDVAICTGAAGALAETLSVGDVVVGTETIEHDINNGGKKLLPTYRGAETVITQIKSILPVSEGFTVHFCPIASGDEDVVGTDRRRTIHELTGAFAVAWEGAGGARACDFSDVPFVEIRGISDQADNNAESDFRQNLDKVMRNIATLIICWTESCHGEMQGVNQK